MPKITIIQVIYNSKRFIKPVFEGIFNQSFKDFNVVAVIAGNDDRGKEFLVQMFPQVEIIDPGYNIGFAAGHNLVFEKYSSDFYQLVNPDLILETDYVGNILKVFDDPKVGAATGKLYKVDQEKISNFKFQISNNGRSLIRANRRILDTTGVNISKSGRARDRGQHEVDRGQYDRLTAVDGISGAGAMYRRKALENIKIAKSGQWSVVSGQKLPTIHYPLPTKFEYFDEDFHSYWEDVDLSWRMANAGWKNVFVPSAVGYHGRAAGSSRGGYKDIVGFIKHHRQLSPRVRELNYKNHIFMYIKNSRYFYPQFFFREFFMLIYVLIFETATLKVLSEMFRLLPKMWKKRKYIKRMASS